MWAGTSTGWLQAGLVQVHGGQESRLTPGKGGEADAGQGGARLQVDDAGWDGGRLQSAEDVLTEGGHEP